MSPTHEPWLVALSLLVAFQGSYVGLHLARQIGDARGARHRRLIGSSALTLALAVWTMHFVGMLAIRLPFAADFLVLPTLLSFLVCVLVVGFAVFAVGCARPTARRIGLAALFMGGGIVVMHYLGMLALHAGLHLDHDPALVAASIAVGVAASGVALWLGFGETAPKWIPGSAALMALAISAMHYTAMAGTTLHGHDAAPALGQPALSPGILAVVVSIVAFLVSGLFLLTLVPVPAETPTEAPADAAAMPAPTLAAPAPVIPEAQADGLSPDAPPETRPVAAAAFARTLPVEKDGLKRPLDVARLVAVQAQAHYTQLFDGDETWFCPLTISEVEAKLDPAVFARVHRSHIVNLDRIATLKRSGDAAEVSLASRVPYRVPVARSRNRWLKEQLQLRVGAAQ